MLPLPRSTAVVSGPQVNWDAEEESARFAQAGAGQIDAPLIIDYDAQYQEDFVTFLIAAILGAVLDPSPQLIRYVRDSGKPEGSKHASNRDEQDRLEDRHVGASAVAPGMSRPYNRITEMSLGWVVDLTAYDHVEIRMSMQLGGTTAHRHVSAFTCLEPLMRQGRPGY